MASHPPPVFRTTPVKKTDLSAFAHGRAMKAFTSRAAAVLATAALAAHAFRAIAAGLAVLALLIYLGIALPAVWSAKAARRKAAADVLRQILNVMRN